MKIMYTAILFVLLCLVFLTSQASGQQVEVSSTINPVGSGARATGMGGAFIAVADDATAASWNPAGLIQLEKPEISAVYSYFHRKQEYDSSAHPEVQSENSMDTDGLNYSSIAYPFKLFKRNMIVSLNYQRLYEMDKEVRFVFIRDVLGDELREVIDFSQNGFLHAFSPAVAIQVVPRLSLGATLNIWDNTLNRNGWDNTYNLTSEGTLVGFPVEFKVRQKQDISFEGINAHFGFLWTVNQYFTIGGVYKTAFDADLVRKTTFFQSQNWPTIPFYTESLTSIREDLTMKMPPSYGVGVAYRHSDNWTVTLDVYRTEWSRFVIRDERGRETNPLTSVSIRRGRLKDTTQVRAGTEYLFISKKHVVPLRFGLFYDPEPETGSLDEYYGFSLGSGYARGRMAFDVAYQYRTADNITGDIPSVKSRSVDVDQHLLMASVIIYLD